MRVSAGARLERWLVPASLRTDWRVGFLVRTWAYGLSFSAVFFVLALVHDQRWLLAIQLYFLCSSVVLLALLQVTQRLRLVAHISLGMVAPYLGLSGLAQNPANPLTPVFLVLLPLVAGFFFVERWERWTWLMVAVVLGGGAEWAMANGYHAPGPLRPNPGAVAALNLTALLVLVVSFVRWFDGNRRDNLARLEAAQQARTIFLANVSHEIRTPMNGVLGLTELVLGGPLEPGQRERLELVQRSGQSLVTLIDDLLLLTRAESGRLTLSPTATPVTKVVTDVVELFMPVAQQKQVGLRAEVDATVPPLVELDSVRWRQVLTNLVSNAVKFTERGVVEVRLANTDGRLVLTVSDQGVGIDAEVLTRLFQPFEQGDVSTTRRFGGSGLGLALSRQLVEAMHGSITVRSKAGEGSVFTVDVPLVRSELATGSVSRGEDVPARADQLVLVVDDNPINLKVAQGLVERAGYRVQVAHDGQEAVDAAAAQDFALVLMDCQMPQMDGLEATRRIRASVRNSATPIIAVTASGLDEQVVECRLAGMNDVLVKPVSLEQIKRALALAR